MSICFFIPISWAVFVWLVVWLPSILFSQKYWVSNHPNWLSYFSEGWPNHQPVVVLLSRCISIKTPSRPITSGHIMVLVGNLSTAKMLNGLGKSGSRSNGADLRCSCQLWFMISMDNEPLVHGIFFLYYTYIYIYTWFLRHKKALVCGMYICTCMYIYIYIYVYVWLLLITLGPLRFCNTNRFDPLERKLMVASQFLKSNWFIGLFILPPAKSLRTMQVSSSLGQFSDCRNKSDESCFLHRFTIASPFLLVVLHHKNFVQVSQRLGQCCLKYHVRGLSWVDTCKWTDMHIYIYIYRYTDILGQFWMGRNSSFSLLVWDYLLTRYVFLFSAGFLRLAMDVEIEGFCSQNDLQMVGGFNFPRMDIFCKCP